MFVLKFFSIYEIDNVKVSQNLYLSIIRVIEFPFITTGYNKINAT